MIARRFLLLVSSSVLLAGLSMPCFADASQYGLSRTLNQIESHISQANTPSNPAQSMRDNAIKRAAIVYGAQSGRFYRWQQIQSLLVKRAHLLSHVFDFSAMYLDSGLVQPPVLDIASNVTHISHAGQMRELINNVYRVLIPANFKSRPITWQSFLLPDSLAKPTSPREALLPRNDHETALWHDEIKVGWHKGIIEANSEFDTRLNSLSNAYKGMVLYTMLAMRGMVAPPHIVSINKTVDSATDGQKMAVGIHKQVIAKNSYFVAEPNRWKPVYYDHNFAATGDSA